MAKNRTEVGNFWQKVINFYVSCIPNLLLLFFNNCFVFRIRIQLDATFPRKWHFWWRHNYVNTTWWEVNFERKCYMFLVKRIIQIVCVKIVKIHLNLLKLFTEDCGSFFRTRCIYSSLFILYSSLFILHSWIIYMVGQKVTLLLDAFILQCLFTHISFSLNDVVLHLLMSMSCVLCK